MFFLMFALYCKWCEALPRLCIKVWFQILSWKSLCKTEDCMHAFSFLVILISNAKFLSGLKINVLSAMRMGGPIWNGRLHNPDFVTSLLGFIRDEGSSRFGSWKKILATVSLISEELPDSPLFLTKEMMFSAAKVSGPKLTLVSSAILNAGFKFRLGKIGMEG